MSKEQQDYENLIFSAIVNLEKARAVLDTTTENYKLGETNLSEEDRTTLGLSAETIGNLLIIVDDYIYSTLTALQERVV